MQTKQRYTRMTARSLLQHDTRPEFLPSRLAGYGVRVFLAKHCVMVGDGVIGLTGYRFVYGRLYKYKRGDSDQHTDFWRGFRSARSL